MSSAMAPPSIGKMILLRWGKNSLEELQLLFWNLQNRAEKRINKFESNGKINKDEERRCIEGAAAMEITDEFDWIDQTAVICDHLRLRGILKGIIGIVTVEIDNINTVHFFVSKKLVAYILFLLLVSMADHHPTSYFKLFKSQTAKFN